jgi:PEP-CTERM motif
MSVGRLIRIATAVLAVAAISTGTTRADSLMIDLSVSHNGTAPSGSTPWLTADFESTTAGTVTLTLTNNMPSGEFTPIMLFNTTVDPANLTFSYVSGPTPNPAPTGGSTTGDASIKAGTFNVEFQWTTANNANRFSGGTTVVETITDATDSITAASFNALSTGSQGGFLSASKIQGIPSGMTTASGTIVNGAAVPEPSSVLMAVMGFAGVIGLVHRRRRRLSRA